MDFYRKLQARIEDGLIVDRWKWLLYSWWKKTCQCHNYFIKDGVSTCKTEPQDSLLEALGNCLNDHRCWPVFYEILCLAQSTEETFPFKVRYLHSDGGMRKFDVLYQLTDELLVLVMEWDHLEPGYPEFNSLDDLVDWLHMIEEEILQQVKNGKF